MAFKTGRTVITFAVFFAFSFLISGELFPQLIDPGKSPLDERASIDSTDFHLRTGAIKLPDGERWSAIFEERGSSPKMIFSLNGIETGKTNWDGSDPVQIAMEFMEANREVFKVAELKAGFASAKIRTSPGSTHIEYRQMLDGLPVFDASVVVHVDNYGNVEMVNNDSEEIPGSNPSEGKKGNISAAEALATAEKGIGQGTKARATPFAALGYVNIGGTLRKIFRITYLAAEPLMDWLIEVDAETGAVLSKRNLTKKYDGMGYIQSPNPLKSPQRVLVNLPNLPVPGLGTDYGLSNKYIEVSDSTNSRVREGNYIFDYQYIFEPSLMDESPDSDPRFEQVMAYFHLERFRLYYRDLGFHLFTSYRLKVDAHGTDRDESTYSGATKEIVYGDGGVNDASDADIILHEAGHALVDFIKPSIFHDSGEVAAMHEGYADYFAASFFDDPCIGEWDVHYSDRECLRRTDGTKHYPENVNGREYEDCEIWSSVLWDLRSAVRSSEGDNGLRAVDRIIAKGINYLPEKRATFRQGGIGLLMADRNLYGKRHAEAIWDAFQKRGIFSAKDRAVIMDDDKSQPSAYPRF